MGFGGSVRGPEHKRQCHPNQDAWTIRRSGGGIMAAVADGLGSAKNGEIGSKAACAAAMNAFRLARKIGDTPSWLTIAVLRATWHQLVARWGAENCGTTCLACFIAPGGSMFATQVGDGVIAIRRADASFEVMPAKTKSFQNSTDTVASQNAKDWSIFTGHLEPGDAVLMATDGISDDLDPSQIGSLIAHLLADYLPLQPHIRAARIRSALKGWPTRHHRDDKTFVVLTRTS